MKTKSITQLLQQYKVVVPPIQRDYAQGRETGKVPRIRERFLDAIVGILATDTFDKPLELDFIYGFTYLEKTGDLKEISYFQPLDGQQRLTTLFLIHWYIANKEEGTAEESILAIAKPLLKKFSYATRHSSQLFCDKLIEFTPDFNSGEKINDQIINQPWFFSAWHSNPTISSMLIVLKDIETKFSPLKDVWSKLTGNNPRIIFHLLAMNDLGLPDDLYIKMNSRGKELTDFEHFKSQFSDIISNDLSKKFNNTIDKQWSDLFWNIFKDKDSEDVAKDVDAGFLSFFWYITDILIVKNKIVFSSDYWLSIINEVYSIDENVKYLFDCIELFEDKEKSEPNYFSNLLYINEDDFLISRTRIFFSNPKINLFHKCAESYGYDGKPNNFSVGEQLLLYAVIYSELNNKTGIEKNIRKLRNLFSSSEDQLRKEFLTYHYEDVEEIINSGQLSTNSKLSKRQIKEEDDKQNLLSNTSLLIDPIYRLEDHTLLRGNIAIFDLDDSITDLAAAFHSAFNSTTQYFKTSRAMLTIADYSQGYSKLKRFGNRNDSTWRQLLTQSEFRKNFSVTKSILKTYLNNFLANPTLTDDELVLSYLSEFENNIALPKDWIYYYIKYSNFILWDDHQTDGYYSWENILDKPYECTMMFKYQWNGRHWSPFLLSVNNLNPNCTLENYGNDLQFTNGDLILMIKNVTEGFKFISNDEYSNEYRNEMINNGILNSEGILLVSQDSSGKDLEDRIIKCNTFLKDMTDN